MSFLTSSLLWLQQHVLEVIAVITGLLYIYYTIRENVLLWLFGILSSGFYIVVFYHSGIYAYSLLYVYYVVIGFYGWYNWSRKQPGSSEVSKIRIHRASAVYIMACIGVSFILALPIYYLLKRYTGSDLALADALLTSGGMVATWMLTQKIIQQWHFWIIIDLVSFAVMIYKGLYPSSLLFMAYTLLALKGYLVWKKELKAPEAR